MDPVSAEARRIELEQIERHIHAGLSGAMTKMTSHLKPIVQVHYDPMAMAFRATTSLTHEGKRYRAQYMISDAEIDQFTVSVRAWENRLWDIAKDHLKQLSEALPDGALVRTRENGWYEANGDPGVRERLKARGLMPNIKLDLETPIKDQIAGGVNLSELAKEVQRKHQQEKVEEQMAVESIKDSLKHSSECEGQ